MKVGAALRQTERNTGSVCVCVGVGGGGVDKSVKATPTVAGDAMRDSSTISRLGVCVCGESVC